MQKGIFVKLVLLPPIPIGKEYAIFYIAKINILLAMLNCARVNLRSFFYGGITSAKDYFLLLGSPPRPKGSLSMSSKFSFPCW